MFLYLFSGHFRILGRNVHMDYVKEQLGRKGVSFVAQRERQPPAVTVEVLADSLFIQVSKLHTDTTQFFFMKFFFRLKRVVQLIWNIYINNL